jgi:hypothetical protein
MDLWKKQGMLAASLIMLGILGNSFADTGAGTITNTAAQTKIVKTGFLIHQNRNTHFYGTWVGEFRVKGAGGARLDAGQILTHFTGDLPWFIMGRTGSAILEESNKF